MAVETKNGLIIERILAEKGEAFRELQGALDRIQRVQWIESMGPWEVMMTGTFRWEASMDSARRCFTKWIGRRLPEVSYFYSLERNPSRDGCHVHSLWADARNVFRRDAWASWVGRYGRARIEAVRSVRQSSDYASKYLCKPNCWWDCMLQWHRKRNLNGTATFSLDGGNPRKENESQGGGSTIFEAMGGGETAPGAQDRALTYLPSAPHSLNYSKRDNSQVLKWKPGAQPGVFEAVHEKQGL